VIDLALEDDQLLLQEGVLGDELGLAVNRAAFENFQPSPLGGL